MIMIIDHDDHDNHDTGDDIHGYHSIQVEEEQVCSLSRHKS